jgi:glycosyltransferase involved in cell wall biosynthesis
MRVTHIITRLVVGGAQENTVATVRGLLQKPDLQVDLISGPSLGPEGSMESALAGFPEVLTIVPDLVRPIHPLKDFKALKQLTAMLRVKKPEIVHTHSGKAGILGRIAARKAGVPIVIHHIHGPSFGPFQGRSSNLLLTAAERYAGRLTTHFVCSANAMTRRYLAAGIGRPEMYTRVFSGFKVEPFLLAKNDLALRKQLGFDRDSFIIGKIGRLAPLKGHEDLFRAVQLALPHLLNARILLVGDGALRAELESKARDFGLSGKVVFTGLVPPSEVPRYVGIMDCLAHLSYREAVSRALPQALAAGKPVIAYDFDGADEVCLEGETGFLIRTGDVEAVAKKLELLAANPDLRERFGHRGRELVSREFNVEQMIETFYQLYLRLHREHTSGPGLQ